MKPTDTDSGGVSLDNAAPCPNLRAMYGHKHRVDREPPATSWHDPWSHRIPCKHGHIYPHGDALLGFASRYLGPVAYRVAALPFTTVEQVGDDGMNISFPVDRFDEVTRIVKPRRRRELSGQHKLKLAEASRKFRFVRGSENRGTALERPQTPLDDSRGAKSMSDAFKGLKIVVGGGEGRKPS